MKTFVRKDFPPAVEELRECIKAADAILFVTPEYNYSVPGVLKNAIDWASRPPDQPFNGKPAAIMGASPSMLGTGRAQYHLRQICVFLNIFPVNQPEVLIAAANKKFDENGRLTDEATRKFISQLIQSLVDWTGKTQGQFEKVERSRSDSRGDGPFPRTTRPQNEGKKNPTPG